MADTPDVPGLADLAARLERLETLEAARQALYRYADGADLRDWSLLGSAFSDDAVLVMPGSEVRGRDQIVAALRGMLPDAFVTQHLIVNPQATWTAPGRATVSSTVYYLHEGSGYEATGWGRYVDDVAVVDGVGVITRKEFLPLQHLPGSIAATATRVDALAAAERAREATWRYATAVDSLDFDLLADAFTTDAVLTTSKGSRHGRDTVVDYYRTALAAPVDRRHFLVNQHVDVTGPDEATVTSSFLYTYAGPDTSILGWGRYVDVVRPEDGTWRIASKTIAVDVHADTRTGWAGEITP